MNPRIQLAVRNAVCEECSLAQFAEGKNRCVTATGSSRAKILVVTKFPLSPRSKDALVADLRSAGFQDADDFAFTGAAKCLTYDANPSKADLKACKHYLDDEIDFIKPDFILALGNEALTATTGRSGIMKYRGKLWNHTSLLTTRVTRVMATIAPAAAARNPGQKNVFDADLRFLYNTINDVQIKHAAPIKDEYKVVDTKARLAELLDHLRNEAYAVSFDLETSGFDELAPDAFCVSIAMTTIRTRDVDPERRSESISDAPMMCWSVPLRHRASRWASSWQRVLELICKAMKKVKIRIAHNSKFDCRWLEEFGGGVPATFDTMIAAHLLNENRSKGLKTLAQLLLGAEPWDIQIKSRKGMPWYNTVTLKDILKYNGLDTWHTMRLWKLLRQELIAQPRLGKIFLHLMMPGSRELVHVERAGVWASREDLAAASETADKKIAEIDNKLMDYINVTTPMAVNFNPSNFLRWFLFKHLELPVIKEGKAGPSVSEPEVLSKLKDHHPAVPLLLERSEWNKMNSAFFKPYQELITADDRIHTTFKITGTVTGRLSSGKADLDKVTGARQTRGMNMQQVPRLKIVRSIFGADPGWVWCEADYSQIELRIAAWIAQEPEMLRLYNMGEDIHMATAMRMTGKPASKVTPEERKKAKAVNFGFLYGMGWRKFIETAWNNYQVVVTEAESQAFRKAFFDQFSALLPWHARQRRLVHKYKRVESPLGRIRHLPDIDSPDRGVANEAERQAINSPVQATGSDLCLLSLITVSKEFRKRGMQSHAIGTVHDAINFNLHPDEADDAITMIKQIMENPPLERLFGVELNVPIVADFKVGERWGTGRELEFA